MKREFMDTKKPYIFIMMLTIFFEIVMIYYAGTVTNWYRDIDAEIMINMTVVTVVYIMINYLYSYNELKRVKELDRIDRVRRLRALRNK